MKHFNLILALILTMQTAFAGVITDDKLELGKPSSSSDKQLIFKGPTSKTLKSSSAGNLNYNGNGLTVGDGANTADKTITFNKGVNSPSIKYNFATGTIQFSNDNVNFLDMGSGSGGAGGIQMLSDPEFEKATISTYWTPSAGTLTALTSGGDFSGFDKQSASWTPAAASNTLSSETITIVNGLLGARGSASIFYKTASALHKLQVYDGSTVIAEKLLPANTGYKKEEFTFSIPTSGTIQLRILAGDTTPIYADKAFLGVPSSYPADEDFAVVENLFPNPKAEGSSPSWLAYKDAAGLVPVDGVNGSPTLSCSLSSSAPLEKTKSFLITKPASNVQGEGCAHDLKVLSEPHKAKVLQVSFDYKIASGTYTDDTLKLYAYDIDNAQLFELAPTYIKNSSLTEPYRATFQTSLTGTKYRLIWHYAGTDAVATSIKIDNVRVSSQLIATGSYITDWQTYTTGCSGSWTTNTTYECKSRVVGDSMEFQVKVTLSGAPNAVQFSMNLPVTIDSSKTPANFGAIGNSTFQDSGVASYMGGIQILGTSVYPYSTQNPSNGVTTTLPFTWGAADSLTLDFRVPVVGKTANTMLSSEYSQRKIFAQYRSLGGVTSYGASQIIKYTNAIEDSHGAYNPISGLFTCPVSTKIKVTQQFYASGSFTYTYIGINGSAIYSRLIQFATSGTPASLTVPCLAGQTIAVYNVSAGTTAVDGAEFSSVTFEGDMGGTQVAVSEGCSASYRNTAATTVNNTPTTLVFPTKVFDTCNLYNPATGIITASAPGKYSIKSSAFSATALNSSTAWYYKIVKGASTIYCINVKAGTGAPNTSNGVSVGCDVDLLTGETAKIETNLDTATSINLDPTSGFNTLSISRIAN